MSAAGGQTGAVINGKVAAVIDDTTLVINVGQAHGVEEGMGFVVYSEHQDIIDPDSGEPLGKWEIVKAPVVVTHTQQRMSTVRSLVPEAPQNSSTLSTMMVQHSLGQYGRHDRDRQKLPVQAASSSGRPQVQPIKVGDLVRSVPAAKATETAGEGTPADPSKKAS